MKRFTLALIILLIPVVCSAAGSGTVSKEYDRQQNATTEIYTFALTADSGNGSVPNTVTLDPVHGYVVRVVTDPGSTSPTADYDIVLNDSVSADTLGGEGADRSATVSEQVVPKMGNGYGPCRVDDYLTLALSNNSVNSATVTVVVYVMRD